MTATAMAALETVGLETVKVSNRSNPSAVAGALARAARTTGAVRVQVVGAGALNQAVKALAVARTYLAGEGLDLWCAPGFSAIEIDGEARTAIVLEVETRALAVASGMVSSPDG